MKIKKEAFGPWDTKEELYHISRIFSAFWFDFGIVGESDEVSRIEYNLQSITFRRQ